jgi:chromosome segregation ATPase
MEKQLQQLDRLGEDKDFQQGMAKKLNDALAKGDLKKAQQEIDQLRKKIKDKKLDKEEQEKLSRDLQKMKEEMQRLAQNKERQEQLQKKINEAKKAGKDAEALERELDNLKQQAKQSAETTQRLAQKFQKAQDALKKGDFDEAARQLEQAGQSLAQTEEDLKDLEDAQDYLQRLKSECKSACKACQGGDENDPQRKDYAKGGGRASGLRDENKDAKTASNDERVRGLFDPRGKKTYGGATRGPAFKKATTAELGPAIQEAAQEAPRAADSQRLPRDAKDTVREYFQNLGGQSPGGNK